MRQLTLLAPGELAWREVAEPRLEGDGEAIVRPLAIATCDLDLALVRGNAPAGREFAFGHECVAEVVAIGDAVTAVAPGDLVSVPFQISCGECARCRRGETAICESVDLFCTYGLPFGPDNGGFVSDAVLVPYADAMLAPVPEGVEPAAVASLSDNIPDAWRTVGPQLADAPGAAVLICAGAGSIALFAVGLALACGAGRVDLAGGREFERELAQTLGANLLDEEFPERLGPYPITVDASADPGGLAARFGRPTSVASRPRSGSTSPPRRRFPCSRCTRRGSISIPASATLARASSRCSSWSGRGRSSRS